MTVDALRRRFYPNHFGALERVRAILREYAAGESTVLDLGAGPGPDARGDFRLRGRCRRVVGLDIDAAVGGNPTLDAAVVGSATAIPFRDAAFDIILSSFALEHLPDPQQCAMEAIRVLKPGGHLIVATPNLCHYAFFAARVTPQWFHQWYIRKVFGRARSAHPTHYRANTRARLRRVFGAAGFATTSIEMFEPTPGYLAFAVSPYLLGVLYERIVNSSPLLSPLRGHIVAVFRRPLLSSASPALPMQGACARSREPSLPVSYTNCRLCSSA